MKKLSKWTEADLLSLIKSGEKESLLLDYKDSRSLDTSDRRKIELSKDISAFANSAGGMIIYGITEDGHIPKGIDNGLDKSEISKKWLEQVINSRIQRRIAGIIIHQVELTTSSPGRVAYVVIIPQSSQAPHQASDKCFYKRFNFSSVPMEEYEIRDVAHRSESPDLSIMFSQAHEDSKPHGSSSAVDIEITISNSAPTPATYIIVHLFIDSRLSITKGSPVFQTTNNQKKNIDGKTHLFTHLYKNLGIPHAFPIFHGVDFFLSEPITLAVSEAGRYILAYEIFTIGMTKKFEYFFLDWNGSKVTISGSKNQ